METPTATPTAIMFTMDSTGKETGGFDYHSGESLPLDLCDRIFTDVHFNYREGKITPLGVEGTLSTYLVEVL